MDSYAAMVRETAERLFTSFCDRETLADSADGIWAGRLWAAAADAGLTRAAVSEAGGGAGLPIADALQLVGIAGNHAAPIPLGETIVAGWLLEAEGLPIPEGPLTLVRAGAPRLSVSRAGAGWAVQGRIDRVSYGRFAAVVIIAHDGGALLVVDPNSCTIEFGANLAGEPRDTLVIDTELPADRVALGGPGGDGMHALGAALRTMQMAGALMRIGAMSVRYAQDRVQFGRPLAKLQAIQQMLAVLSGQVAAANMASEIAMAAIASGTLLPGIAAAKARVSEAAGIGAAIAHQVHGAIGFTRQYDLHVLTRRLLSWRDEFGNEAEWNTRFGRFLLEAGPKRIWSNLVEV